MGDPDLLTAAGCRARSRRGPDDRDRSSTHARLAVCHPRRTHRAVGLQRDRDTHLAGQPATRPRGDLPVHLSPPRRSTAGLRRGDGAAQRHRRATRPRPGPEHRRYGHRDGRRRRGRYRPHAQDPPQPPQDRPRCPQRPRGRGADRTRTDRRVRGDHEGRRGHRTGGPRRLRLPADRPQPGRPPVPVDRPDAPARSGDPTRALGSLCRRAHRDHTRSRGPDQRRTGRRVVYRGQHHAHHAAAADQERPTGPQEAPPRRRDGPRRTRGGLQLGRPAGRATQRRQPTEGAPRGGSRPAADRLDPDAPDRRSRYRLQGDDPPDRRGLPPRRTRGPARERRTRGTGVCDRVQVWVRGRLALEGSGLSEDQLVAAMEGSAAPPVDAEAGHGSTTKADEVHP